jgi:hypothetical protein
LFEHDRQDMLRENECRAQVDRDDVLEVSEIDFVAPLAGLTGDSDAIYGEVDRAPLFAGLSQRVSDGTRLADVESYGINLSFPSAELSQRLPKRLLVAIDQQYPRAGGGEARRRRTPDAAGGTRYDTRTIRERRWRSVRIRCRLTVRAAHLVVHPERLAASCDARTITTGAVGGPVGEMRPHEVPRGSL